MGWNVHLPKAEWYSPSPPSQESRWGGDTSGWNWNPEPLIREMMAQDVVAIDTETTGLNVMKDMPLFWSLAWGERRVCMPSSTLPYFQEVFRDRNKRWILANAKFDMHMLTNVGVSLAGDVCDVAVMHALLYEEASHKLKDMAKTILGWGWTEFKETFGIRTTADGIIGKTLLETEKNNLPLLVEYASNDAYGTLKVYEALKRELEETKTFSFYQEEFNTMGDIFFKTEMPYTRVLWKCERQGIPINAEYLKSIEGPCQQDIDGIQRKIVSLAGSMINPNSAPQLRDYFFNHLKLRPLRYTSGGKTGVKSPSTDSDFLEHYAPTVPMAQLILDFRELEKLKGTYIEGLQSRMDQNNRIHTRFNQDVARTGRLSSADPNMQNIPTVENDKFKLRGAFIAANDNEELIVADYEALEMRLLASASLEKKMIQIFLDKKDIHMGNAAMVFGKKFNTTYEEIVDAKKVDKKVKNGELPESAMTERHHLCLQLRAQVKNIAFGLNYGMKENKLARDLNVTKEQALSLMSEYMDTYPAVKQFYAEAIAETQQTGYSYTFIGRRRYHPAIGSMRDMDRWEEERKAVNNNIQGTAADVVRFAMLLCDAAGLEYKYGCKMNLQVHDELVFECPKETVKEAKEEVKYLMEHPFVLDMAVPLTVSIGSGPSWMHAK